MPHHRHRHKNKHKKKKKESTYSTETFDFDESVTFTFDFDTHKQFVDEKQIKKFRHRKAKHNGNRVLSQDKNDYVVKHRVHGKEHPKNKRH